MFFTGLNNLFIPFITSLLSDIEQAILYPPQVLLQHVMGNKVPVKIVVPL
jgi:hypothetical protein